MLLELSYPYSETLPRWPSNTPTSIVFNHSTARGNICNCTSVTHHLHNGTHVDTPLHFNPAGTPIEDVPIEDFLYRSPLCIQVLKDKGDRISIDDLKPYEFQLLQSDILLIYTGYSDLLTDDPSAFCDNPPCMRADAAEYLRRNFPKLKAIAVDTIGIDSAVSGIAEGFPAHHAVMDTDDAHPGHPLLVFENVNTGLLYKTCHRPKAIYAFPVRFVGAEAAPIPMVAEI